MNRQVFVQSIASSSSLFPPFHNVSNRFSKYHDAAQMRHVRLVNVLQMALQKPCDSSADKLAEEVVVEVTREIALKSLLSLSRSLSCEPCQGRLRRWMTRTERKHLMMAKLAILCNCSPVSCFVRQDTYGRRCRKENHMTEFFFVFFQTLAKEAWHCLPLVLYKAWGTRMCMGLYGST